MEEGSSYQLPATARLPPALQAPASAHAHLAVRGRGRGRGGREAGCCCCTLAGDAASEGVQGGKGGILTTRRLSPLDELSLV